MGWTHPLWYGGFKDFVARRQPNHGVRFGSCIRGRAQSTCQGVTDIGHVARRTILAFATETPWDAKDGQTQVAWDLGCQTESGETLLVGQVTGPMQTDVI